MASNDSVADYDPRQEMRLAVVMYGGVSLAIYMNGVAQEFLNLVKATAPATDAAGDPTGDLLWSEERLTGSMRVYRKLGRMLDGSAASWDRIPESGPVRTRFVIDIVTGTSAGGINGIFLAKALANQQEMDGLTRMWRTEGDLPKLLNDGVEGSTGGRNPDSLLNSHRILELFNEAIKSMEWDGGGSARPNLLACDSPYVEELDLFVTTTDMAGLLVPLRLEDRVIFERRYRNFFHFRYGYPADNGSPYNSFQPLNTTFLAFASRCTSAFPFAFAPMDLETAITTCGKPRLADWTGFYRDYLHAAEAAAETGEVRRDQSIDFVHRPFIDGGCLDNKPFSYAIDALRWKKSDLPVTRKLFYVEPAPDTPGKVRESARRPDALDSVFAGYVDLPRVENIREDLRRLLERNRLIARLKDAMDVIDPSGVEKGPPDTGKWTETTLGTLRSDSGPGAAAYAAYHRMKVSAVTDAIASTVVCAAGLDADSDDALAVRYLVKAWRNATYPDILDPVLARPARSDGQTSARFLLDFDLDYRIRRLSFVRRVIDDGYRRCADRAAGQDGAGADALRALVQAKRRINEIRRGLLRTDALARADDPASGNPLIALIDRIAAALPARADSAKSETTFGSLVRQILAGDSDDERLRIAIGLFQRIEEPVRGLATGLAALYARPSEDNGGSRAERIGFFEASERAISALEEVDRAAAATDGNRRLLGYYYSYESYDAGSFPLLYGTGVGEVKEVEVVRISPEDAAPLCERPPGTAKLAGDSLGHFGAFLEQSWREHDILWGRLDGVDRVVSGLAPTMDNSLRAALIRDGQVAVLDEWLAEIGNAMEGGALYAILTDSLAPVPVGAAQTGGGWKLTPGQFIASARSGAAKGLERMDVAAAESLGARSFRVVSRICLGLACRGSGVWSAVPLRLAGQGCGFASWMLRAGVWAWVALAIAGAGLGIGGHIKNAPAVRDAGVLVVFAAALGFVVRRRLASDVRRVLRGE